MISRRSVMGLGAAFVSTIASALASRSAKAATAIPAPPPAPESVAGTLAPRGRFGRMERLRTLELESRMDFLTTFRTYANRELSQAANRRSKAIVKENGVKNERELDRMDAVVMLKDDPLVSTSTRAWLSCQQLTWDSLRREFEDNADEYLAEMEAVDNSGPGSLELNPDMDMPDYVKYEIHIQPGGYVGNDFAGHMYHYGTNNFYTGRNTQDELHMTSALNFPTPEDGKVLRILDIGTGIGQLAMGMKERFPEAEVWGVDVGGPMVRYAHLRAVERGLDVNFAQRLAEDTKFPDNYFDMVVSYIMFHEVNPKGTRDVVQEAYRVTRPGGVFYPIDFDLTRSRSRTAYGAYRGWWDHRWNGEIWSPSFRTNGLPEIIRNTGFDLNQEGPVALPRFGILNARKPA